MVLIIIHNINNTTKALHYSVLQSLYLEDMAATLG